MFLDRAGWIRKQLAENGDFAGSPGGVAKRGNAQESDHLRDPDTEADFGTPEDRPNNVPGDVTLGWRGSGQSWEHAATIQSRAGGWSAAGVFFEMHQRTCVGKPSWRARKFSREERDPNRR